MWASEKESCWTWNTQTMHHSLHITDYFPSFFVTERNNKEENDHNMQKRARKTIRERERTKKKNEDRDPVSWLNALIPEIGSFGDRHNDILPLASFCFLHFSLPHSSHSLCIRTHSITRHHFSHFEPNVDCFNWSNHRQLWVFIHGKEGRKNPPFLPDALHALSVLSFSIVFVCLIRFFSFFSLNDLPFSSCIYPCRDFRRQRIR